MLLTIVISFLFVSIAGVLFHFSHNYFKRGILVHWFSAINESTWEHMKLAFTPMFIVSIAQSYIFKDLNIFWGTMFITMLISILLIPILYYPVRAIIGKEVLFVSISLYFISIAIAFIVEYVLLNRNIVIIPEGYGILGIFITALIFLVFTYFPPKMFLFKDPVSKRYGDRKH